MGADENSAGKLADAGCNNRLFDSYSFGADSIGHGIGHIVGTDVPGHVQADGGGYTDNEKIHNAPVGQARNRAASFLIVSQRWMDGVAGRKSFGSSRE